MFKRTLILLVMLMLTVFSFSLPLVSAQDDIQLRWRTRPDNQSEADVYQAISDELDASWDGVSLSYEPGGSETSSYQDVLLTELGAQTAPDVFWIPGADLANFASRGVILNLSELASMDADFDAAVFYPQQIEQLTYNPETDTNEGALWGLPRDASAMAIYYNKDLFDEAGLEYPSAQLENGEWNWDTFKETAAAMRSLGSEIYGFGMNNWWGNWELFINAAGGSYFTPGRDACALNSPEVVNALTFMRSLYADDVAVPYGTDSEPPFIAGNVGMFLNGRWATPNMLAQVDFNWDVAEVPVGPAGQSNFLFWGAYVVNANTANPEAAWELVKKLTTTDVQAQVTALGANLPSRISEDAIDAFLDSTPQIDSMVWVTALKNYAVAEAPLWKGDFGAINWNTVEPAITEVLTGVVTPEDFSGSICGKIEQYFTASS